MLRSPNGCIIKTRVDVYLKSWRRLQIFGSRSHLACHFERITLRGLHLFMRRCGHSDSAFTAFDNDRHCWILAFEELFKTSCRVFSQVKECGGSFILVGATVWKLGGGIHEIELWVILDVCPLLNHERVPAVLSHELTTESETLLENDERARCGRANVLLLLTIAQRLKTHVARALSWVLRKHSFEFLIVYEFILWVRVEDNIIALRARQCK